MATIDIPFLSAKRQPTGMRAQAYRIRKGEVWSVYDVRAKKVAFRTCELRLGDATMLPNGRLAGIVRPPLLRSEYLRWFLIEIKYRDGGWFDTNGCPMDESIFVYVSPEGVYAAVPLRND